MQIIFYFYVFIDVSVYLALQNKEAKGLLEAYSAGSRFADLQDKSGMSPAQFFAMRAESKNNYT